MIKAFLFDYDGVITKGAENERIFGTLADNLGVTVEQTTEWLMEIWRSFLKGQLSEDQVWQHVESKYGQPVPQDKRDIWFTWEELVPLDEMLNLVKELRKEGYITAVVSNIFASNRALIQEMGGYNEFDFVVLSSDIGFAKPEPEVFQAAVAKLPEGTQLHEVVFLDDREKNAEAANEMGMLGIYVANHVDAINKVRELAGLNEPTSKG